MILVYNILVAPIGVLGAIYELVVRWYALEHRQEITSYLERRNEEQETAGEREPFFAPNKRVLVRDSATENAATIYARCEILCLTDQRSIRIGYTNCFEDRVEEIAVFQNEMPQFQLKSPKNL